MSRKFYINGWVGHNREGSFLNEWVTQNDDSYIMAKTMKFSPVIIAALGIY